MTCDNCGARSGRITEAINHEGKWVPVCAHCKQAVPEEFAKHAKKMLRRVRMMKQEDEIRAAEKAVVEAAEAWIDHWDQAGQDTACLSQQGKQMHQNVHRLKTLRLPPTALEVVERVMPYLQAFVDDFGRGYSKINAAIRELVAIEAEIKRGEVE